MIPSGLPSVPSPKYLSFASPQPLNVSAMVCSVAGSGNGLLGSVAPFTSTSPTSTSGRKPVSA